MIIVIDGNPVNGFSFYGPFDSSDDAISWGENVLCGDWWIADLTEVSK